ncbi:hypothetical protein [uncultured Bacteroides sp.]|uniref:hypothetical protein n=1 Tax=uncultured Bacteroides sp. TaxID=162156 RepID=UPI0025859BEF|nr:hypothetical protein [uncultured Bacteroides sp.]
MKQKPAVQAALAFLPFMEQLVAGRRTIDLYAVLTSVIFRPQVLYEPVRIFRTGNEHHPFCGRHHQSAPFFLG